MTTSPQAPAILTTPAEAAKCAPCFENYLAQLEWFEADAAHGYATEAARPAFPTCSRFSPAEFAHCDLCGSTDLLDTRSVFEVLTDALDLLAAPLGYRDLPVYAALSDEAVAGIEAQARMGRYDVVANLRRLAETADPGHCSDCVGQAVKASVALVKAGMVRL